MTKYGKWKLNSFETEIDAKASNASYMVFPPSAFNTYSPQISSQTGEIWPNKKTNQVGPDTT